MLSSLLVASIGIAGGTTIYQTSRTLRRELRTEYQLFAENRAFALRDNFEILEEELARLAVLPQLTPSRGALKAASEVLASAHQHSVLYNTAVLMLSREGRCVEAEPDAPEFLGQWFGDRPWFLSASRGGGEPVLRASDEPTLGRTIKIVQPILRDGAFAGALVGVIALADANLITPSLRDNLPAQTDAILVDENGAIIYPTDRAQAGAGTEWAWVLNAARLGTTGTAFGEAAGEEALFAWAPVHAKSGYAVAFAWPWRVLNVNLRRQVETLFAVSLFGILLASIAGLVLSTYLTRPLVALGDSAARIARGDPVLSTELPRSSRADEVVALLAAFEKMETSIGQRDQALREAAALLEQRVRDRTRELVETQKALVESERFAAMGKTSAAIAHEIRNALNGLGMAVELILQDPANAPRVGRLQAQVTGEIARLRDVIDSLLSFSRSPRVDRAQADLVPLVHQAVHLVADIVADRGADISLDMPASLPVICDAHKIQGVLVNLIKNAVESGKHVFVRARFEPVSPRDSGDMDRRMTGEQLVIEIRDDGPGLSVDARQHLFEPFFTTKPNGTGLGLATSSRYVDAHGGRLEVDDPWDGPGAVFRIRLPRVPEQIA